MYKRIWALVKKSVWIERVGEFLEATNSRDVEVESRLASRLIPHHHQVARRRCTLEL